MLNPMSFSEAIKLAGSSSYRRRLRYDEMLVLCRVMFDCRSYTEVGVYDGLSAWLVGATTCVAEMHLIDKHFTPAAMDACRRLEELGITIVLHTCDALSAQPPRTDWCLIDADHSYDATLAHVRYYKDKASLLVLHDIEMREVGKLFAELGGVKIVSSRDQDIAPDGKVLPRLGYGLISGHGHVESADYRGYRTRWLVPN